MKKLAVNFAEIQKAMEDVIRDSFDYFIDTVTGEVITFSEEILTEVKSKLYNGDNEEIGDDIEYIEFDKEPDLPDWMLDEIDLALEILFDEEGKFTRIPERNTHAAYKTMNEFIETVKDSELKEKLVNALNGKGAFRKFKDALIDFPKERKRWHGYNAKAMKGEIAEWLKTIGIEPVS